MKLANGFWGNLFCSIIIGLVSYYALFGLQMSGDLRFIPFLNDFLLSISQAQLMLIALFIGVVYFSITALTKTTAALVTAVCIFLFILIFRDRFDALVVAVTSVFSS